MTNREPVEDSVGSHNKLWSTVLPDIFAICAWLTARRKLRGPSLVTESVYRGLSGLMPTYSNGGSMFTFLACVVVGVIAYKWGKKNSY